jgi:hypothetical protein
MSFNCIIVVVCNVEEGEFWVCGDLVHQRARVSETGVLGACVSGAWISDSSYLSGLHLVPNEA